VTTILTQGGAAWLAQSAHTREVAGSNPAPATSLTGQSAGAARPAGAGRGETGSATPVPALAGGTGVLHSAPDSVCPARSETSGPGAHGGAPGFHRPGLVRADFAGDMCRYYLGEAVFFRDYAAKEPVACIRRALRLHMRQAAVEAVRMAREIHHWRTGR
jgi:hypothetical protein